MFAATLFCTILRPLYAVFIVLGGGIGVAATLVIMNLLNGYVQIAQEAYMGIHAHILVSGAFSQDEASGLIARIKGAAPGVIDAAPAVYADMPLTAAKVSILSSVCHERTDGQFMCGREDRPGERASVRRSYQMLSRSNVSVSIRGIDVGGPVATDFAKYIRGEADIPRLARTMDQNGNVLPVSFYAEREIVDELPAYFLFEKGGLKDSYANYYRALGYLKLGVKKSGLPLMILGTDAARTLIGFEGFANRIEVRLKDPINAAETAAVLRSVLGSGVAVSSWIDAEEATFRLIGVMRTMAFLMIASGCALAAVGVYSTFTLSISRGRKKIALLSILGLPPKSLFFMLLGFAAILASGSIVVGTLLGEMASYGIGGYLYSQILGRSFAEFGDTMNATIMAWVGGVVLVLFTAAALAPAFQALRFDPIENLRQ